MNQASLHRLVTNLYPESSRTDDYEKLFELRLATNLTLIKDLFFSLYPKAEHPESFKRLLSTLPTLFRERPTSLKLQDINRLNEGDWYQSEQLTGMQLYVDHFNKNLKGLNKKLGYFEKLGVNLLHLMPITPRPKGENDGGYAVNSYHEVDKRYGSKKDLSELTAKMRKKNIYLMLDFVANHTSDEFTWAKKAKKGNTEYQNFYHTYQDREIPDAFEKTLPEVFPLKAPGNFTYNTEMQKWVMTVFNQYQWDLNYSNPEVFIAMLGNLLKLVNLGVDIIRLDALAFMWKRIGTESQNLPEAHTLIALFRMCVQVIAPGVIFLAEAIVAPNEIIKYFGTGKMKGNECEVAYNATLMSLLWDAIATKKTLLIYKNLQNLPKKPDVATWINYIRCHDDIGFGFDNSYISEIGWNPQQHRKFLLDYYSQKLDWSPAKGEIFMYNPKTGDGRITGTCASLLGLESALEQDSAVKIKRALAKVIMLHSIILSYGGIPLIYAGDEIGALNDYSYRNDKQKKDDTRWVNRPKQDWDAIEKLDDKINYPSKIFFAIQKLIRIRKKNPVLADHNNLTFHNPRNPHLFIYERTSTKNEGVLIICNFDDSIQAVNKNALGVYAKKVAPRDLISGRKIKFTDAGLELKPYQFFWLTRN